MGTIPDAPPPRFASTPINPLCWEKETEMKFDVVRKMTIAALISAAAVLSACSTDQAIDNTVGIAAGTGKVVAKGAVGAGKLAYRGGKALVGAGE